jgi:hypothetical protein
MEDPKIYYHELFHASEGTLIFWLWVLYLEDKKKCLQRRYILLSGNCDDIEHKNVCRL